MWCEYMQENVSPEDCENCDCHCPGEDEPCNCDECLICHQKPKSADPQKPVDAAEMVKSITEQFQKMFGYSDEQMQKYAAAMTKNIEVHLLQFSEKAVKSVIESKITDIVANQLSGHLEVLFKKALEEEILSIDNDWNVYRNKIEAIIMERMRSFFQTKSGYNSNQGIKKQIDEVISTRVDGMIKTAMDELKHETIEKFTKEMMKKMMQGMAKAIADDKKLLAALDLD